MITGEVESKMKVVLELKCTDLTPTKGKSGEQLTEDETSRWED